MFNCNNVDEWLHLAVYVPCYCRANDRCSVLFCKVLSRWALHDTQQCDMFWVAGFKNDSPEWALLHESRINAVRITGILKYMHVYILSWNVASLIQGFSVVLSPHGTKSIAVTGAGPPFCCFVHA